MEIDAETARKLTKEEIETIEKIRKGAEKRPHVPVFTPEWLSNFLSKEFKEFNYSSRQDAIDMLDLIGEFDEKFNIATKEQIEKDKARMLKQYGHLLPEE